MMWTLDQAVVVVRRLQRDVHALGYHVTLGGGVLNNGESDKDLDLFILRKNNTERQRPIEVMWAVARRLDNCTYSPLRDSPDYGPDADFHFSEAHKVSWRGKRIDVFVQ